MQRVITDERHRIGYEEELLREKRDRRRTEAAFGRIPFRN